MENLQAIKNNITAVLESVIKDNSTLYRHHKIGEMNFTSALFICNDITQVNDMLIKVFEESGMNVVTVTADGYEIPREKATVRLSDNHTIGPILYPGDEKTDELKKKNTVLFLPNLDKMSDLVYRRLLLEVAREHCVADPRNGENGYTELDSSFFAVATVGKMETPAFMELTNMDAKGSLQRCLIDSLQN